MMEELNPKEVNPVIEYVGHVDDSPPIIGLKIVDKLGGGCKQYVLELSKMNPSAVRNALNECGTPCANGREVYNRLMKDLEIGLSKGSIPVRDFHLHLGWQYVKENYVYMLDVAISKDNDIKSEYMGEIDVISNGDIEAIENMINEEITSQEEWSPLEAALSFGIGAVILPFACTNWGVIMDNPILHSCGDSTSGKSTALYLFVGVVSNPTKGQNGLWLISQSSLKSIVEHLGGVNGVPVCIDELKKRDKGQYDEFIYIVGNGLRPERMTAGGYSIQAAKAFKAVVMSTGEISIHDFCGKETGLRNRCFELPNIDWTISKRQSLAVTRCMRSNYGVISKYVARELLNNSEYWHSRWNNIADNIEERLRTEKLLSASAERVMDYVILFTLSAEVANKVMNIRLNSHEVMDFCYNHFIVANSEANVMHMRAYECLMSHYTLHKEEYADAYVGGLGNWNNFFLEGTQKGIVLDAPTPRELDGVLCDKVIVFPAKHIFALLEENGFSPKIVLRKLNKAHYFLGKDTNNCAYYRDKLSINGMAMRCYILYLSVDDIGAEITE